MDVDNLRNELTDYVYSTDSKLGQHSGELSTLRNRMTAAEKENREQKELINKLMLLVDKTVKECDVLRNKV